MLTLLRSRSTIWGGSGLFLLLNCAFILTRIYHDQFDHDELQHAHIAWLIAHGQVPYRDFWDNHGPLFSLLTGFILKATGLPPDLNVIFAFRAVSVATLGVLLALTYAIARAVALGPATAFTAVAILSSLFFVQDKGADFRPDILQNVFWLAGLLLVIRNLRGARLRPLLIAGFLFGLAVMTNAKAMLGPICVGGYIALEPWLRREPYSPALRALVALTAGALPAYLAACGYFWAVGAVGEFHFFNFEWNLVATRYIQNSGLAWSYVRFFLSDQLPFVMAAFAGLALWLADLRSPIGTLDKERGWLLLIVAVGTSSGWALNLYSQFFLMFLPLLAVISSFGLARITALSTVRESKRGAALFGALLLLAAGFMLRESAVRAPFVDHPILTFQKAATARFLREVGGDEPVGTLWSDCPAYVFRDNLQYYWTAYPAIGMAVQHFSGENPFGARFISTLEDRQVRFIIGRDDDSVAGLPGELREYLHANFVYEGCAWRRR